MVWGTCCSVRCGGHAALSGRRAVGRVRARYRYRGSAGRRRVRGRVAGEDASVVAEKIIARLTEPFDLGGNVVRIGASVGVAFYPDHGASAEQLLRHADLAMYQAKLAGRGAYRIYEPAMTNKAARQASFENNLRLALERKEFAVYYQPILEVDSGRLVGAEALLRWHHPLALRWHHPLRGIVPPSEFIALAEETGLIGDIGTWVLEDVCQTLERWHRIGLDLSAWIYRFRLTCRACKFSVAGR